MSSELEASVLKEPTYNSFSIEIYERVQKYTDGIRNEGEFKVLIASFKEEHKPSLIRMLKRGLQNSILVLETISEVLDPATRQDYLKQLEGREIPEAWVDAIVLGRDQLSLSDYERISETPENPHRVLDTLMKIKVKDMESILRKTDKVMDSSQENSFRRHAQILGSGHQLVIDRLKLELAKGPQATEEGLLFNSNT